MKVKYIIKYKKGQRSKQVTGFVRIPKDLPEGFESEQFIEWACKRHNLTPDMGLEIILKNYINKSFNYDHTIGKATRSIAQKAAGSRNQ